MILKMKFINQIIQSSKNISTSFLRNYNSQTKFTVYCSGNIHDIRPEGCSFNTVLFESEPTAKLSVKKAALVLHDLPGNALQLRHLSQKLSNGGYHVFGINLPGSGYTIGSTLLDESVYTYSPSENADYVSYIVDSTTDIKYDLLVGIGLGSYIACMLATCLHSKFTNLCLIDPPDVSGPNSPLRITDSMPKYLVPIFAVMWSSNFILRSLAHSLVGLIFKRHKQYLKSLISESSEYIGLDWRRIIMSALIADSHKDTLLTKETCTQIFYQLSTSNHSLTLIRSPLSNENQAGSRLFDGLIDSFDSVTREVDDESDVVQSNCLLVQLMDSNNLIHKIDNMLCYNDEYLASAIFRVIHRHDNNSDAKPLAYRRASL